MKSRVAAFTLCIFVLLVLMSPAVTQAQVTEPGRRFVISTNPILDMFTWYNAEFEIALGANSTVGISGTYITFGDTDDWDEETYMAATFFYRYYPTSSFEGFYFGGRLGFNHVKAQVHDYDTGIDEDESGSFFAAGIDVGYSWLLGDTKKFYVSMGVGAVRLFGEDLETADVSLTLPTIRLINVGIAF